MPPEVRKQLQEGQIFQIRTSSVYPACYRQTGFSLITENYTYDSEHHQFLVTVRTYAKPLAPLAFEPRKEMWTRMISTSEDHEDESWQFTIYPKNFRRSGANEQSIWNAWNLYTEGSQDIIPNPLLQMAPLFLMDFSDFPNLRTLYAKGNTALTTEHLNQLPNLTFLDLTDTDIPLENLSSLTNLQTLYVEWNRQNIEKSIYLPNLQTLCCVLDQDRLILHSLISLTKELISLTEKKPGLILQPEFLRLKQKCEETMFLPTVEKLGILQKEDINGFYFNTEEDFFEENSSVGGLKEDTDQVTMEHGRDIIKTFLDLVQLVESPLKIEYAFHEERYPNGVTVVVKDSHSLQEFLMDFEGFVNANENPSY